MGSDDRARTTKPGSTSKPAARCSVAAARWLGDWGSSKPGALSAEKTSCPTPIDKATNSAATTRIALARLAAAFPRRARPPEGGFGRCARERVMRATFILQFGRKASESLHPTHIRRRPYQGESVQATHPLR